MLAALAPLGLPGLKVMLAAGVIPELPERPEQPVQLVLPEQLGPLALLVLPEQLGPRPLVAACLESSVWLLLWWR
jgi:hypothetical protein